MTTGAFLTAFGLVFLAELGDKTQLAVVTQTCRTRMPLPVLLGGSLALTLVAGLGVLGGRAVGAMIPEVWIRIFAALAFAVMGGLIWREARKTDPEEGGCACPSPEEECAPRGWWSWRAFGATLLLLALAELGDKTQLAVLALTTRQADAWGVFAGAALALTAVTALGVLGGQWLCRVVPTRILLHASAALFLVMGGLIGSGVI